MKLRYSRQTKTPDFASPERRQYYDWREWLVDQLVLKARLLAQGEENEEASNDSRLAFPELPLKWLPIAPTAIDQIIVG